MDERELDQIEQSLKRSRPFGAAEWAAGVAKRLGLQSALAPIGRPRKPLETLSKRQLRRRREQEDGHKSG